jgi:putative NADPH-quinone reductase
MGYCDVHWACDENDRKFTTGYAFLLGDGVVSWSSKCQPTIALSTIKAEYNGSKSLCKRSHFAVTTIGGYKMQARWRDYGHVRQLRCQRRMISTKYCSMEYMMADVLTKALARGRHEKLIEMMGFCDFVQAQSGSVERYLMEVNE